MCVYVSNGLLGDYFIGNVLRAMYFVNLENNLILLRRTLTNQNFEVVLHRGRVIPIKHIVLKKE